MSNPSRWLAFYFRPRDGEHCDRVFNRCPDILTWTHCETLQIAANANPPGDAHWQQNQYGIGAK